jgi:hypothetical protein
MEPDAFAIDWYWVPALAHEIARNRAECYSDVVRASPPVEVLRRRGGRLHPAQPVWQRGPSARRGKLLFPVFRRSPDEAAMNKVVGAEQQVVCAVHDPAAAISPLMMRSMENPLSQENFSLSRFKPHGSVRVWPEGNVVYLDCTGPFNREFFSSLFELSDTLYGELKNKGSFVEIATLRRSMLMPLDALEQFGAVLLKRKALGRAPLATAWIISPEVEDAFIVLPAAEKKFAEAERPFRAFDAMDEAETWARSFLTHA